MSEILEERIQASTVRLTREGKIKRLIGKLAIGMAKHSNDPIYARYVKSRLLYLQFKKVLLKKYGMKAKAAARQVMQKQQ